MNEPINISSSKKTTTPTQRRKDSGYHVTDCQSHSQIDYHNTTDPAHIHPHPCYFPRGNYYVRPPRAAMLHRSKIATSCRLPPLLQATHFLFPVSLPRSILVLGRTRRQTYTKEPDRIERPRRRRQTHSERQGKPIRAYPRWKPRRVA